MGRAILGAILGYVATVAIVLMTIAIVWFSMGSRFAFVGDTQVASLGWIVCIIIGNAIAALIGGVVAKLVGGGRGTLAVKIFVGLILVLGVVSVAAQQAAGQPALPEGKTVHDLSFAEAGTYAVSPLWFSVLTPIEGAVLAWIGGTLVKPKRNSENPTEA
jgi:hypothetical protein